MSDSEITLRNMNSFSISHIKYSIVHSSCIKHNFSEVSLLVRHRLTLLVTDPCITSVSVILAFPPWFIWCLGLLPLMLGSQVFGWYSAFINFLYAHSSMLMVLPNYLEASWFAGPKFNTRLPSGTIGKLAPLSPLGRSGHCPFEACGNEVWRQLSDLGNSLGRQMPFPPGACRLDLPQGRGKVRKKNQKAKQNNINLAPDESCYTLFQQLQVNSSARPWHL